VRPRFLAYRVTDLTTALDGWWTHLAIRRADYSRDPATQYSCSIACTRLRTNGEPKRLVRGGGTSSGIVVGSQRLQLERLGERDERSTPDFLDFPNQPGDQSSFANPARVAAAPSTPNRARAPKAIPARDTKSWTN